MKVGVIGLGRMGAPMARRIISGGHSVTVFDIDADALARAGAEGADCAGSPAEVAAGVEVVLSSVPGPAEVEKVMTGTDGVLGAVRRDAVIVETSTIGPDQCRALAAAFAERGARFLDSPISGGVQGARDGTLTVMVGGDVDALARARSVLNCIATNIRHLGDSGAGSTTKLINQMVFLTFAAVLCEGVALAASHGLEAGPVLETLSTSVAASPMASGWHDRMRTNDTENGFQVYRVLKDLRLVHEAAASTGIVTPAFEAALNEFENAAELGFAEQDLTVIRNIVLGNRGRD